MRAFIIILLLAVLAAPAVASAEPTEIIVRVLAKDSKFVGTSMGGMRIILRDAHTSEILATGVTQGGTGNTKLIMHDDKGRQAPLADDSATKFIAPSISMSRASSRLKLTGLWGSPGGGSRAFHPVGGSWPGPLAKLKPAFRKDGTITARQRTWAT